MRHVESLPNRFNIPIKPDKDGYLGRECPIKVCKGYFKITPGTGLKGRDGLVWQAVAMAEYLEQGRLQSPVYPMSESVALARTLDEVETQLRAANDDPAGDDRLHDL